MSDRPLAGKVVLVTGAASGIGRACAELAHAQGASVFLADRDDAVSERANRLGAPHLTCDLAQVERTGELVSRCADVLGGPHGLVNAAGIFQTEEMLEITPEDFDRMFEINVRSLFFLQQAAAIRMKEHGEGGSIVNLSSTAARVPRPISSHYAAAKAAVLSLSRSAAVALAGYGIRVNAICPGVIETPMVEAIQADRARLQGGSAEDIAESWRQTTPMKRLGRPRDVAEVAAFLLSDASSYVTGESIGVTGGVDDL